MWTATASAQDSWWGSDKALHFSVSAALSGGSYAGAALILDRPGEGATVAVSSPPAWGGGTARYGATGQGAPWWGDFTWTGCACAVGLGTALLIAWAWRPPPATRSPPPSASSARFALGM